MISSISGIVKEIQGALVTIDIGPLALEMHAVSSKINIQDQVFFYTYLHWNQEQGPSLYGFSKPLERTVFLMIIGCSGIGPKLGMAILNHMGASSFLEAIQTNNSKALSAVSGVGAKKADQLIVALREKTAKLIKTGIDLGRTSQLTHWTTVSETLESLNYSRGEISAAMKHLGDKYNNSSLPFDQLMRHALVYLAKKPTLGI